jgi:repressor LexA
MKALYNIRKYKDLTQEEMALFLNLSRQRYANYENGTREPDNKTLVQIANKLEVSTDFLLDNNTKSIKIPVLGKVAAGIPIEAIEDIIDFEEISKDMVKDGSEYIALKINGNSMEPKISKNDVVIVKLQEDCETGDIAIVLINGDDATCKKIKKTPEGVMLISLNPAYEPMFYSNKEINELPVRILGKVVELRAKF